MPNVRNLRQLLGRRVDIHRGVAAKHNVALEDEHVQPAHDPDLRLRPDHLQRRPDRFGIVHVHSRYERVRVTQRDHHAAKIVAIRKPLVRFREAHPLPLPPRKEEFGVFIATSRREVIFDLDVLHRNARARRHLLDHGAVAEENRLRDPLVEKDARSLDDLRLLALRKDHSLRALHRPAHDPAHDPARAAEPRLE